MAQSAFDATLMGGPPYFDDFEEAKRFLKVLFRPGRPLQSRELSQVQSILQNQIERFGRHVFEEGSVATGGSITECATSFVRVTEDLTADQKTSLVGKKLKSDSSSVNAIIIGVEDRGDSSTESNDQFCVLCINYITAGTFSADEVLTTYGVDDPEITVTVKSESTGVTDPEPTGTISNYICMDESIFFSNGYFVLSEKVQIAAHTTDTENKIRDFSNTTCSIGFDVNKSVVDADDDTSLNDPAFGFYNYNSPGADRFKITFTPVIRSLTGVGDPFGVTVETGTDFIEIVRIVNGNISKKVKYPEYADLESTLARRTFDESGNYTVKPFNFTFYNANEIFPDEYTAGTAETNAKSVFSLSSGKAYLNGYEYEASGDNLFILDRPRTSTTESRRVYQPSDHYDYNAVTPKAGSIDSVGDEGYPLNRRRRTNLQNLQNIIGGQKRIYLLDIDGMAVGTCFVHQIYSRLGSLNEGLTDNDAIVFQFFNVESLGEGNLNTAHYVSEKYISVAPNSGSVPAEDQTALAWESSDTSITYDFFIFTLMQNINNKTKFRKGRAEYFKHVLPNSPTHSARTKYIKNMTVYAFKSFSATAENGVVTINTGGGGLRFAGNDSSRKAYNYTSSRGYAHQYNYDFTIMKTDALEGLSSVNSTPFHTLIPSSDDLRFEYSDDMTSVTIRDLGETYNGNVVVSAPVILDYSVNNHAEQTVVRKALDFDASAVVRVTETISQESLSFCDSDGDGILDASDQIFVSKQFLFALRSATMAGSSVVNKFNRRFAVDQARSAARGSDANLNNRVTRGFLRLDANESLPITGDLVITYDYYPTATYGDGDLNDGEVIIANSYAKDAGSDSAQNPRFEDVIRTPLVLAQSAQYSNYSRYNFDFKGYEYIPTSRRGTSDTGDVPQSDFNRAFTFGKDRDGGFMIVGLEDNDDLVINGVFYNHVPHTLYLDEDRKVKLATGSSGLLISDNHPRLKSNQMRIADIRQYGFGHYSGDIGVIAYDNQRTTMAEINEMEKDLIDNEKFDRLDNLETKAYTKAKSVFPQFSPTDHGIYVDTFEDWQPAWTTNNPDFNSSLDIVTESLRPNFTNFYTSDASLSSNQASYLLTDDNIAMPAGSTAAFIRTDTAASNEVPTTRTVNPNGIVDFHGHAKASPFTATYWNNLFEPRVENVMDTYYYDAARDRVDYIHPQFGDVFKKNGNGVNYRDHELHWYGMDTTILTPGDIGIDGSHINYLRRRKPKAIRRAMKKRPTRSENTGAAYDRVVDEAVRYRGLNYTVTVEVKGLKPNTTHRVFQTDETGSRNVPVGRGAIATFTSDSDGSKTFTFEHPEVYSGEEYYLITDAFDPADHPTNALRFNGIQNSTSSADFFIQNTGLFTTEEYGIKNIRPMKPRRDASNLATYENRYYENIPITSTVSYNSFTPLTQTFTVDAVENPLGIFLESIDLYFKQVASNDSSTLPVTVRVHPIVDGVPNYNVVLPFSEVTALAVTENETFTKDLNFSRFKFSTPLVLSPGEYAFTVESNDSEYILHTATESQNVVKPLNAGRLYVPSNNGQSEAINNEFIRFRMNRMEFIPQENPAAYNRSYVNVNFTFQDSAGGTATNGGSQYQSAKNLLAASYYIADAPTLFTSDEVGKPMSHFAISLSTDEVTNPANALGGNESGNSAGLRNSTPNRTIMNYASSGNIGPVSNSEGKLGARIYLGVSENKKVANVVDLQRLGIVAQRFNLNGPTDSSVFGYGDSEVSAGDGVEVRNTDQLGSVISRYYSKYVYTDSPCNDLVVNLSGIFPKNSRPVVLVKLGKNNADVDKSPYFFCTYNGNAPINGDYLQDGFPTQEDLGNDDAESNRPRDYSFRLKPAIKFGTNSVRYNPPSDFTHYRFKVLLLDGSATESLNDEDSIIVGGNMRVASLSALAGIKFGSDVYSNDDGGPGGSNPNNDGDGDQGPPSNDNGGSPTNESLVPIGTKGGHYFLNFNTDRQINAPTINDRRSFGRDMEAPLRGCHKSFRLISPINNSNNFVGEALPSGIPYNDGHGADATLDTDKALKITNPPDSGRRVGYLVEGILNFAGGLDGNGSQGDIFADMTRTKVIPFDEPDGEVCFRASDVATGGDYRGSDVDWGQVPLDGASSNQAATKTDNSAGGAPTSRDDRTLAFQDFVYLNPGEKIFYRLIGRKSGTDEVKVRPGSKIEVTVISHTEP